MVKSKISAPVGFFNAKCKPRQSDVQQQQDSKLVFSVKDGKTYTRYIADDGQVMYSLKIQQGGVILKHVIGADGIVKSPQTVEDNTVFSRLFDYMQSVKQQNQAQPLTKTAPKKNIWCQYEKQETPTVWQSLGFSLELIPTGKFVTVEFINKRGEVSRYNGRTGVKKYLKLANFSNAEQGEYFILWVRRAGVKFDSVAMIHKRRIVKLSAGGVVLWQNKQSHYAKTI